MRTNQALPARAAPARRSAWAGEEGAAGDWAWPLELSTREMKMVPPKLRRAVKKVASPASLASARGVGMRPTHRGGEKRRLAGRFHASA